MADKIDDTLTAVSAVSVTAAADMIDDADTPAGITRRMQSFNKIYATGALKAFLQARAQGASRKSLMQLGAAALLESEEERAAKPAPTPPRLRLIWPPSDIPEEKPQ